MGQPFARFEAGVETILGRASIRFGTPLFSYLSVVYTYGSADLLPTNCVLNDGTKKIPQNPPRFFHGGETVSLGVKDLGQQKKRRHYNRLWRLR